MQDMKKNRTQSYYSMANSRMIVLRWLVAVLLGLSAVADTMVTVNAGQASAAAEKRVTEYQIKAVYLYNFLLFAEWPEDESGKSKDSIVIGIVGKDPFKDAFKPVEGKDIFKGKKLVIRRFEKVPPVKSLRQCDLLFISSSLQKKVPDVLKLLEGHPVLTVSEIDGFIETGGMINLLTRKDTVKFEINKAAAQRVGIKFRSKLLRVAVRVIENNHDKENEKQDG